MASVFKRLIAKKVSEVVRCRGIELPEWINNISTELKVSNIKNDYLEMSFSTKSLNKLENNRAIFPYVLSIEPDSNIERVYSHKNKEIVFSINRDIFINKVINSVRCLESKPWKTVEKCPEKEKIVLEYSSPNIAKPFHLGHLRSTIIGNFAANLFEVLGHDVIRINYLGDWGTQFGLLSLGIKYANISEETIEKDPINILYSAYVNANKIASEDPSFAASGREIFFRFEDYTTNKYQDESIKYDHELKQWEKIRMYTEKELKLMYDRLGVRFDEYSWESEFRLSNIKPLLSKMEKEGILELDSDGKKVVKTEKSKKPITLLKSDGSTLYLTRDVACALDRFQRHLFDRMYYVVDNSQNDHFQALFSIIERLGLSSGKKQVIHPKIVHLKFGRVRGMSTRKGTAVFLKDILDEAQSIMKEKILLSSTTKISKDLSEKTADILGTSAVIVNDLKQRRQKDYSFDWDRILQVEGDTGIKLQYTHCRLCNLEKNSGVQLPSSCNSSALSEAEAVNLVREIARFEEVLMQTYEDLEACHLVDYLFQLCNQINKAFKTLQVKNQPEEISSQRLLLFHVSKLVLRQGMCILGLRPLEIM